MKKFLKAAVALTAAFALTACGSSATTQQQSNEESKEQTESDKTYKIGVLQLTRSTRQTRAL